MHSTSTVTPANATSDNITTNINNNDNTTAQQSQRKVALITGIIGQTGSYLAEYLLNKNYIVHGLIRRSSLFNTYRLEHIYNNNAYNGSFYLHYGDVTDSNNLVTILTKTKPNEIYHLAAQSHTAVSFELTQYTANVNAIGTLRLLDAVRTCGLTKYTKIFHASTGELYGNFPLPEPNHNDNNDNNNDKSQQQLQQDESTPVYPRSPYAISKLYAHDIIINYREAYGMYAVSGILFNHESIRRGPTFVTRKTTRAVARIKLGLQDCLYLGNLDVYRDWGHAIDYVDGIYKILNNQPIQNISDINNDNKQWPTDYILSTGKSYTIRDFVTQAFKIVNLNIKWQGTGLNEIGINTDNNHVIIRIDSKYYRPTEVYYLCGNSNKARNELNWSTKYTFYDIVKEMVLEDIKLIENKKTVCNNCGNIYSDSIHTSQPSIINPEPYIDVQTIHESHNNDEQCSVCSTTTKLQKYKFDETRTHAYDHVEQTVLQYNNKQHNNKVALITGVTGQDGSYLAELLLNKGYIVHGIVRRSSSFNTGRIQRIYNDTHKKHHNFYLHYGDLTDSANLTHLIGTVRPDELYNLAAQSHVKVSFEMSEYTADIDALGTLRLLDAIRVCGLTHITKFYQASTSELYGGVYHYAVNETTSFYPRSPYAVAKQYAYWIVVNYREAYNMYAVNGILFNHESPRRGETFVTRKITRAVAHIKANKQQYVELGNLDASRDWGHAQDYVEGMWRILNCQQVNDSKQINNKHSILPKDYVLSSNETHTVREFVEKAFKHIGINVYWHGQYENEYGTISNDPNSTVVVKVNRLYYRPSEVDYLLGDCSLAKNELQWNAKYTFDELIQSMIYSDCKNVGLNVDLTPLPSPQHKGDDERKFIF